MARYAKGLSVLGLVLAAWVVFWLIRDLWIAWNLERLYGFDEFPHLLGMGLSLWCILLLGMASVLLRRLARPAPAGNVVRGLARFWAIPSLCLVGFLIWAYSELASHPHFPEFLVDSLNNVLSTLCNLAIVAFSLGALPPLWVLSRQSRPRSWGEHYSVQE